MTTVAQFNKMFGLPREPATLLAPGQHFQLDLRRGTKVLVTDVYVRNVDGGDATLQIGEQTSPGSIEIRYTFPTQAGQTLVINFTTGLKLGDLSRITGVWIINASAGTASILARITGVIVG